MENDAGREWMRQRLPVALGIAGILLGVAALLGPWWWASDAITFRGIPQGYQWQYGIFGLSGTEIPQMPLWLYSQLPQTAAVFSAAEILLVTGLFGGGGMVVVSGLLTPGLRSRALSAMLGYAAAALTLAAALYVMALLPNAASVDLTSNVVPGGWVQQTYWTFWGSWSGSSSLMTASWSCGASWGWYVAVAAAFLFGAATTLLLWRSRSSVAAP